MPIASAEQAAILGFANLIKVRALQSTAHVVAVRTFSTGRSPYRFFKDVRGAGFNHRVGAHYVIPRIKKVDAAVAARLLLRYKQPLFTTDRPITVRDLGSGEGLFVGHLLRHLSKALSASVRAQLFAIDLNYQAGVIEHNLTALGVRDCTLVEGRRCSLASVSMRYPYDLTLFSHVLYYNRVAWFGPTDINENSMGRFFQSMPVGGMALVVLKSERLHTESGLATARKYQRDVLYEDNTDHPFYATSEMFEETLVSLSPALAEAGCYLRYASSPSVIETSIPTNTRNDLQGSTEETKGIVQFLCRTLSGEALSQDRVDALLAFLRRECWDGRALQHIDVNDVFLVERTASPVASFDADSVYDAGGCRV